MNQNPEQRARDAIDRQLIASGWIIQNKSGINLDAGPGVAVREYQTAVGPADYALFVDGRPVGIVEAKREEEGERLSVHEDQAIKDVQTWYDGFTSMRQCPWRQWAFNVIQLFSEYCRSG